MIRATFFLGLPLAAAAYFSGIFGFHYSHVVSAPPEVVASRLGDLDFGVAPGISDSPSFARSLISHERTTNGIVWTVRSGQEVAMRFYADLTPVEQGKTKVTTRVERGDAPDDHVAQVFREPGIALGLFSTAVEGRLAETAVAQRSEGECRDMVQRMFDQGTDAIEHPRPEPTTLTGAIGRTSKDAMRLAAMQQELERQGCAKFMNRGFRGQ